MSNKAEKEVRQQKEGENTQNQELSLTDEQGALMDLIGFGECVQKDGRKLRHRVEHKSDDKIEDQNDYGLQQLTNASEVAK